MILARGHAEALLPLVERVVARVEGGFEGLDRVAVTVGPGSYTGLRVGLSAARAIGLATGIPVVGVTTLSALLAPLLAHERRGPDRRRDRCPPRLGLPPGHEHDGGHRRAAEPSSGWRRPPPCSPAPSTLVGSGAPAGRSAAAGARGLDGDGRRRRGAPEIAWVASLGMLADPAQALPRPLYLRGPDAQPQDHARLARR